MALRLGILLVSLAGLAVRFINLEADFPQGLNWSGDLYTDEGWYSRSAVQHQLSGEWIQEGDFNPIITLPIFQLIQAAAFRAFGLGLAGARISVVLASVLICALSFSLMARLSSPLAAWLTLLLLSCSFPLYAFARLAILELPMTAFVLMGFWLATWSLPPRWLSLGLAALAFLMAALTKSTALLSLPAALFLVWRDSSSRRRAWLACGGMAAGVSLGLAAYYAIVQAWQPDAFGSFLQVEFEPRLTWAPLSIARAMARAVYHGWVLDRIVYPLTVLTLPVLLLASRKSREGRLIVTFSLWLAAFYAALAVRGYLPPRYYLPMSIPLLGLFGMMVSSLWSRLASSRWSVVPALLLAGIVASNLLAIGRDVWSPRFSFIRMAEDVAGRIRATSDPAPMLLGNMASSITLATGIPSVNSELGTRDLTWKLDRYRPGYYIALGREAATVRQLNTVFELQELASYDVFGNYRSGKQVHLYRLIPKPEIDSGL